MSNDIFLSLIQNEMKKKQSHLTFASFGHVSLSIDTLQLIQIDDKRMNKKHRNPIHTTKIINCAKRNKYQTTYSCFTYSRTDEEQKKKKSTNSDLHYVHTV